VRASAEGGVAGDSVQAGRERAFTSARRRTSRDVSSFVRVGDLVAQTAAEHARARLQVGEESARSYGDDAGTGARRAGQRTATGLAAVNHFK